MPTVAKTPNRSRKPVRQSVTIPAPLAVAVRRVAKERHLTMSRALVSLAERGVQAELDAKKNLKATYQRFLDEQEPARKDQAGKDLIRAIFGKDAVAEDSVL
jgi:cation transport ATPase